MGKYEECVEGYRNDCCRSSKCDCQENCNGGNNGLAQLRGIQLQLKGDQVASINSGSPIIFDTVVNHISMYMKYELETGVITVMQPGIYLVEWYIAVDGVLGGLDTFSAFKLVSSQGQIVESSNPNPQGQVVGNALLTVYASPYNPVTFQLVNSTDGIIAIGAGPVKANLIVTQVAYY